ncbi:MAG: EF-P lysine aminoacylase GenX [Deltaproteobacteria bacterium]|nr:EF-P lysine aminoacylase GenX [Deltaproteobacteria bacterium]
MAFVRFSNESLQKEPERLETLRKRHAILAAIRRFFDAQGFVEVETPCVVLSPGLERNLDALEVIGAGRTKFLNTSPEYHMKRLLVAGLPRIYQICKCFRRDERGPLHQTEFTMLEWYRCVADWNDLMRDTEELVAIVAGTINNGTTRIRGRYAPIDLTPPWERISVAAAFQRYADTNLDDLLPDEERFYRLLVERVEPRLGRERPVFLTHYPADMACLARLDPADPKVAERFEAYVDGIELCNGFSELADPEEQKRRFENELRARRASGKIEYPVDQRFISALERGLPECGGNALGVDRLIMLILGANRIDEVMAFSETDL